jgi:hypothetical protein
MSYWLAILLEIIAKVSRVNFAKLFAHCPLRGHFLIYFPLIIAPLASPIKKQGSL